MLVFEERVKPEYPEKNLSEQMREPTTNSIHVRIRGQIGGRPVLSPLLHPLLPIFDIKSPNLTNLAQNRFVN